MDKTERLKEIFRFGINGGVSTVVDMGLLYILKEFFNMHYLVAAGISFTVSVVVNYIICLVWVFEGAQNTSHKAKAIFIGSSVIGLVLNLILMRLMVGFMGVKYYMLAKAISTVIVMVWNYIMKRKALVND